MKYKTEIYLIGFFIAFALSLIDGHGLDWAMLHSLLSWVYVFYSMFIY